MYYLTLRDFGKLGLLNSLTQIQFSDGQKIRIANQLSPIAEVIAIRLPPESKLWHKKESSH